MNLLTLLPTNSNVYLMENGDRQRRSADALAYLYANSSIAVNAEKANLLVSQEYQFTVYFCLWSRQTENEKIFKFWFTNEEDYALALLVG